MSGRPMSRMAKSWGSRAAAARASRSGQGVGDGETLGFQGIHQGVGDGGLIFNQQDAGHAADFNRSP